MLYQAPEESDIDFKTELQRMTERTERLAYEANQEAELKEQRARILRKQAQVLTEKSANYRRLWLAESATEAAK